MMGFVEKNILRMLSDQIREKGPIPAARISVASARGTAKKYRYLGVVRYLVRVGSHGFPTSVPQERARGDRRSFRLAERDLAQLCESEGRIEIQTIGRLSGRDALVLISDKDKTRDAIMKGAALCPDEPFVKESIENGEI